VLILETIVQAHNFYQQPGGEDEVFRAEGALLESYGHRVERFTVHNADIAGMGRLSLAAATVWNRATARRLREILRDTGARIVHFHNTLPIMSPSVYYAARAEGAAVVQTLHNYRLACLQGFFLRDGRVCEDCLGEPVRYSAVVHGCYRGSRVASGVAAGMIEAHRAIGTWRDLPDTYIALSEFGKSKMIVGGLPAERIVVKPNFVAPDPEARSGKGGYALFAGRLAPEKGLDTLLEAWVRHRPGLPLRIVGTGPMAATVAEAASRCPQIVPMGIRPHDETVDLIGNAAMVIVPSIGLEPFGLVVIEALACGTPVVASRLGSLPDLIEHGSTGRLFTAADPADLAIQVVSLMNSPTGMRVAARARFLAKYTAERNYEALIGIYRHALARRAIGGPVAAGAVQ
jgi:glycosyltransferase involved in cell wall biosynthesis